MTALGKNVGADIIPKLNLTAALGAVATNVGAAFDLTTITKVNSVRAVIGVRANLDDGDTLIMDNIKLVSDTVSNFAGAVTRITASDVTLTGATGDSNVDYLSTVNLDLDLTSLPATHRYLRVSARTTLSDTTNTSGQICGVLVFGGLAESAG